MRPHRRQPTRLPHPWDSPGKNTGVGYHFLLQCLEVKSESEVSQLCPTLSNPMDCSLPGSYIHGIFQARVLEWGAIAFSAAPRSAAAKSLQSCPTLSDPMDCSLPGSSVHGIFQARVLEWSAIALPGLPSKNFQISANIGFSCLEVTEATRKPPLLGHPSRAWPLVYSPSEVRISSGT